MRGVSPRVKLSAGAQFPTYQLYLKVVISKAQAMPMYSLISSKIVYYRNYGPLQSEVASLILQTKQVEVGLSQVGWFGQPN